MDIGLCEFQKKKEKKKNNKCRTNIIINLIVAITFTIAD